ncbi:MAG: FeoA family protein [Weeksellaceae bacterium]|nr:FeoA family protein [Weeksellaceae bacterium]
MPKIIALGSLDKLKKGERAQIIGFSEQDIPAKYAELGIVPGAEVQFRCAVPFNGPICLTLCQTNCILALRKNEAQTILIEKMV